MSEKSPTLTTQRAATEEAKQSVVQRNYLIAYNGISFTLWSIVTLRMLLLLVVLYPSGRLHGIYEHLYSPLLLITQTLAIAEIFHSALGLVRASPITTLIQVYSRILVVWLVIMPFPEIIAKKKSLGIRTETVDNPIGIWAFIGCLAAWGPTEMIKYGYFVGQLGFGGAPSWWNWLRFVFPALLADVIVSRNVRC